MKPTDEARCLRLAVRIMRNVLGLTILLFAGAYMWNELKETLTVEWPGLLLEFGVYVAVGWLLGRWLSRRKS